MIRLGLFQDDGFRTCARNHLLLAVSVSPQDDDHDYDCVDA